MCCCRVHIDRSDHCYGRRSVNTRSTRARLCTCKVWPASWRSGSLPRSTTTRPPPGPPPVRLQSPPQHLLPTTLLKDSLPPLDDLEVFGHPPELASQAEGSGPRINSAAKQAGKPEEMVGGGVANYAAKQAGKPEEMVGGASTWAEGSWSKKRKALACSLATPAAAASALAIRAQLCHGGRCKRKPEDGCTNHCCSYCHCRQRANRRGGTGCQYHRRYAITVNFLTEQLTTEIVSTEI